MTEHQTPAAESAAAGTSLMEQLRAKRRNAAKDTTKDLPIAGYGGQLFARYRILDPLVEGDEIGRRVSKQFKDDDAAMGFYAMVDTMVEACVGLYVRVDEEKELQPLDPDGLGAMTYADGRVAAFLDLAIDPQAQAPARDTVVQIFGGKKAAVQAHAQLLNRWMVDPADDVLGELS